VAERSVRGLYCPECGTHILGKAEGSFSGNGQLIHRYQYILRMRLTSRDLLNEGGNCMDLKRVRLRIGCVEIFEGVSACPGYTGEFWCSSYVG
jgi:hypothetical protein